MVFSTQKSSKHPLYQRSIEYIWYKDVNNSKHKNETISATNTKQCNFQHALSFMLYARNVRCCITPFGFSLTSFYSNIFTNTKQNQTLKCIILMGMPILFQLNLQNYAIKNIHYILLVGINQSCFLVALYSWICLALFFGIPSPCSRHLCHKD